MNAWNMAPGEVYTVEAGLAVDEVRVLRVDAEVAHCQCRDGAYIDLRAWSTIEIQRRPRSGRPGHIIFS